MNRPQGGSGPGDRPLSLEIAKERYIEGRRKDISMLILLALLLVLLFAGLGFAVHLLWIAAVVLFVLWLVGLVLGRGEAAGRHHFYRW